MHESRVGSDRLESLREALVVTGERERLDVIAPFRGDPFTSIPAGTEADVAAAVDRAEATQASWADRPVTELATVLERYADRVLDAQESVSETAADVRWGPPDRTESFALFSRSGFVEGLAEDVDDNWSLFGPDELNDLL